MDEHPWVVMVQRPVAVAAVDTVAAAVNAVAAAAVVSGREGVVAGEVAAAARHGARVVAVAVLMRVHGAAWIVDVKKTN